MQDKAKAGLDMIRYLSPMDSFTPLQLYRLQRKIVSVIADGQLRNLLIILKIAIRHKECCNVSVSQSYSAV